MFTTYKDPYWKYALDFISSDYLTITSKDEKMIEFYDELLMDINPQFEKIPGSLPWGTPYEGHFYRPAELVISRLPKPFIGERKSNKGFLKDETEYIVNIPGVISDKLVEDTFKNPEIQSFNWRVTRVDFQLSLMFDELGKKDFKDVKDNPLTMYYRKLKDDQLDYESQQTNERPVELREYGKSNAKGERKAKGNNAISLKVGSGDSGTNSLRIYTPDLKEAQAPIVRVESCIRNYKSFIKSIKKNGLDLAKFNWLKKDLDSIEPSPLLKKHRAFFEEVGPSAKPLTTDFVISRQAIFDEKSGIQTTYEWFQNSAIPAIKRLLASDEFGEPVKEQLISLLEKPEESILTTVKPKPVEAPVSVDIEGVEFIKDFEKELNADDFEID